MDLEQLLGPMLEAASASGQSLWNRAKTFAIPELEDVAKRILAIEIGVQDGDFSEDAAKDLLALQLQSAVAVMEQMAELTIFEAQQIINAALGAIRDVVNGAVGFALL